MTIRRAFGTLSPIIYFVSETTDAEGRHNIMLAPYSAYPTPSGYSREEADTLPKVDDLQKRLQDQESRKLKSEAESLWGMNAVRQKIIEDLRQRLYSSDTPLYERDFITAYLSLAEERRAKWQAKFAEATMYLYARENDLGSRHADEERAPNSIDVVGGS